MTAKEYLSRGYRLDEKIASDNAELLQLKTLATGLSSPQFDGMPHGQAASNANYAKTVEKIASLECKILNEIQVLIRIKTEIRGKISEISDTKCEQLLRLRYLNYNTWENIAEEMGYSVRWVYSLHGTALKKIADRL